MKAVYSLSILRSARSPWLTVSRSRRQSKMDSRRTASTVLSRRRCHRRHLHLRRHCRRRQDSVSRDLVRSSLREDARPRPVSSRPARLSPGRESSLDAGTYLTWLVHDSIAASKRRDPSVTPRKTAGSEMHEFDAPTDGQRLVLDVAPPAPRRPRRRVAYRRAGKFVGESYSIPRDSASRNTVATTRNSFTTDVFRRIFATKSLSRPDLVGITRRRFWSTYLAKTTKRQKLL